MPPYRLRRVRHRGLRLVYEHVPGPLTAIALSVRAGARFDGHYPGVAHVAEHMLFQGTTSLDQLALNRRAAELGGEHNADTGREDIAITFEVFNSDVSDALALLAEQYYHTRVDPARLRKERRIVLDEIRGRLDDAIDHTHTRAWSRFYRGAMAQPVCGTAGSLRRLCPNHVRRFIRRHFVHRNTALAIIGGAPEHAVLDGVRRHFRHGTTAPAPEPPPVISGGNGKLRVRRRASSHSYVLKMIELACVPQQLVATGIALDVLGSDPDSELFQVIRERHGLGYDVSTHLEWGPDWAVAVLAASAGRGQADRLRRVIEETCERAAERGFPADDLARARKKLRYRYASLAQSRLERALAYAEGALTNLPTPDDTERIARRLKQPAVERAWRAAMQGRSLTAILDG